MESGNMCKVVQQVLRSNPLENLEEYKSNGSLTITQ